ncbi:hypothetical protein [Bifidobacterium myosotis]|uniref:Uncharacterized protein n=1 Tax=Bifidobacterium myosotis TaxID=1630166 RepID=A0A5M9ZKK4_9BIFI|nr:hypothetical protein [Bifidobacterium myosotis]KAA8828157.1 hypothetical protein EMO91_06870 [Bifidobacterium myosotis]
MTHDFILAIRDVDGGPADDAATVRVTCGGGAAEFHATVRDAATARRLARLDDDPAPAPDPDAPVTLYARYELLDAGTPLPADALRAADVSIPDGDGPAAIRFDPGLDGAARRGAAAVLDTLARGAGGLS